MIQITFQAALDPFHTVFRNFRLRSALGPEVCIELDKLRILDFYLQFPFRINEIKFFRKHMPLRKLASTYEALRPYGNLPESHVLFARMQPIQSAAIQSMVYEGYYSRADFDAGIIASTSKAIPNEIATRVEILNKEQKDLIDALMVLAADYNLYGSDGLKARSNLLEYRYDAV